MEVSLKQIHEVKDYILAYYKSSNCAATPLWSQGNGDDVFQDGYNSGESNALYVIGEILGMDLDPPEEPEYEDWEDQGLTN